VIVPHGVINTSLVASVFYGSKLFKPNPWDAEKW